MACSISAKHLAVTGHIHAHLLFSINMRKCQTTLKVHAKSLLYIRLLLFECRRKADGLWCTPSVLHRNVWCPPMPLRQALYHSRVRSFSLLLLLLCSKTFTFPLSCLLLGRNSTTHIRQHNDVLKSVLAMGWRLKRNRIIFIYFYSPCDWFVSLQSSHLRNPDRFEQTKLNCTLSCEGCSCINETVKNQTDNFYLLMDHHIMFVNNRHQGSIGWQKNDWLPLDLSWSITENSWFWGWYWQIGLQFFFF